MSDSTNTSRKKFYLSIRLQALFWFTLVFTIVSIMALQVFSDLTIREADKVLQNDLTQAMIGAAEGVDVNQLISLAENGEPNEEGFSDDPRYVAQLEWLDTVHQSDPDIWPYLYIESETEGYVYFVVDLYSLYDEDKAAGFLEHYESNSGYILLGLEQQTYRAVDAPLVRSLRLRAEETGSQIFKDVLTSAADAISSTRLGRGREFGTYSDKFGRWASGYMPLETDPGQPRAAIGVDYQASFVESLHNSVRTRLRQFFLGSYALGALVILFLGHRITNPIIKVIDKAKLIGDKVDSDYFESEEQRLFDDELHDLEVILSEMVEKIQRRDQRYRAVVSTQSELITRWAPDGTFTFINPAFTKYFSDEGYDNLSQINFDQILPPDQPEVRDFMQNTLPNMSLDNPSATIDANFITSDGEQKYIQWNVLAIFNSDGHIEEYQAVGRDVTEMNELMEKLDFANQQLHGLSHELIVEREKDRTELARELHDSVLNYISDLFMHEKELSTAAQENYQLIVNKIRETIYDLRPPMLNYGLYLGLEDCVDDLQERYDAQAEIVLDLPASEARFDPDIEIQIYRIFQEACSNALAHGEPSRLWITGEITEDRVLIELKDDGKGFEYHNVDDAGRLVANKKFGLVGMQERARLIGADLDVDSAPGKGTRVRLAWSPDGKV